MSDQTREIHCRRTVNDGKDRCPWRGPASELEHHAQDTADDPNGAHRPCIVCHQSLADDETQTCTRCIRRSDETLSEILDIYATLPTVVHGSGFHTGTMPGGDALVMIADGSMQSPQTPNHYTEPREVAPTVHVLHPEIPGERSTHPAYVEERVPSDGREHVRDHWTSDPPVVLAVLEANERDWRHEFGHQPAEDLATVAGCVGYLRRWLRVAARTHPGFDDYVREMRTLLSRMQHTAGVADDPERAAARCFDCREQLERHYGERGLTDMWTCSGCGRDYTWGQYLLALRAAAMTEQGFVPLSDASRAARIPGYHVRNWFDRGQVGGYCQIHPKRRNFVWWPDVHDRVSERNADPDDTRVIS